MHTVASEPVSLRRGESRSIAVFFGEKEGDARMVFEWRSGRGTYTTDLSRVFFASASMEAGGA